MGPKLRLYAVLALETSGCASGCAEPDRTTTSQRLRGSSAVESTSIGGVGQTASFDGTPDDVGHHDLPDPFGDAAVAADASATDGSAVADGSAVDDAAEDCRSGAQRCNELTSSPEQCDANGKWQQHAMCARPQQTCRVSNGVAACNDNTTFTLGEVDAESGWLPWTVPNGQAYFMPVELPVKAVLSSFVLRAAGSQGSCTMAIYEDAAGKPSKLLAETFARLLLQPARQSAAPNGEISLKPGRYWIGGECFFSATSAQLYSRASDGATYFHFAHTEATYPNDPIGAFLTGETFSFGITVGRLP